ncbi:MAG: hypothetical protein WAU54_15445 [Chania sp.]
MTIAGLCSGKRRWIADIAVKHLDAYELGSNAALQVAACGDFAYWRNVLPGHAALYRYIPFILQVAWVLAALLGPNSVPSPFGASTSAVQKRVAFLSSNSNYFGYIPDIDTVLVLAIRSQRELGH